MIGAKCVEISASDPSFTEAADRPHWSHLDHQAIQAHEISEDTHENPSVQEAGPRITIRIPSATNRPPVGYRATAPESPSFVCGLPELKGELSGTL